MFQEWRRNKVILRQQKTKREFIASKSTLKMGKENFLNRKKIIKEENVKLWEGTY